MQKLKYSVIKSEEQYISYCEMLERLDFSGGEEEEDEIELLTLLIKTWEERQWSVKELDPVQILRSLMKDHSLSQSEMAEIAGVVKSTMSEILHYKRRMSRAVIRKIADHFKIRQEALNRTYPIKELNKERILLKKI